jgi:hypothetical protein
MLIIGIFVAILNYQVGDNVLETIRGAFNHNKNLSMKYISYEKNEILKEKIKYFFTKFIMLMSQKNISQISECEWINNTCKEKLLEYLPQMKIVPFKDILEIRIMEKNTDFIKVEITSSSLLGENQKLKDRLLLRYNKNSEFILDEMEAYLYTDHFPHVTEYLENAYGENISI